ncbi:MAG TPA: hypothetical protein VGK00_11415 [Anaerolineales bacterium]
MKHFQFRFFALISVILIAVQLLSACAPSAHALAQQPAAPMDMSVSSSDKSSHKLDPVEFRQAIHKLWEDHITWTRIYIISAVAGLPETGAAAGRLLQNQVDIGNSIKPFYGAAAGDQLTALLKDHILIAVDLLNAAKAGDTAKFNTANQRWYENANQIAAFLNTANPKNWPLADMQSMMKSHLDLTLAEASARLKADWPGDVVAYDKVHNEILMMSDMVADGIINQFPKNFAAPKDSQNETGLTMAMDKLWEDHVQWTRYYIISATSGLPDAGAAAGRLLQNQVDIGNAIKPIYGDAAGNQLTALLKDHILIAVDLLNAAKAGDTAKFNAANQRWYDNANQIAAFLNAANPKNWPLAGMQSMMKTHLDLTLAEASARLKADWPGDVVAYDKVHNEILQMSGMLSEGIINQFPAKFK